MKPFVPLAIIGSLAIAHPMGSPQQTRSLESVRWLAGCWEIRSGERSTIEMWMPPAGNLMLGASRTVVDRVVRGSERLSLELIEGRLVYTADPSGQSETAFSGPPPSDSGFVVENPAHDFPTRIIYRRLGADSLIGRIEGPGPGGIRGIDFPMRRVACRREASDPGSVGRAPAHPGEE